MLGSALVTTDSINPQRVMDLLGGTVQRVAAFLSNTVLVLIIMVFILAEATVFPQKFKAILGEGVDVDRFAKVIQEVQAYLGIKTVVSLATGLILGVPPIAL